MAETNTQDLNTLFKSDRRAFVNALIETFSVNEVSDAELPEDGFTFELVDSEGGFEGGGEYVERVVKMQNTEGDFFFFKFTGSYYSHDGTEMDGEFEFVKPKQVTVTQYFPE